MDNKAMYKISYGLYVLTANDGNTDNGCIINTAVQVTSSPNRISIAVNKLNYTHDMLIKTGEFNISVIDETAGFSVFENFGFHSGKDYDKFKNVKITRSANGIAYLTENSNTYLSGKIISTMDMGSHTLFIADVTDGAVLSDKDSMTYAFYHKNIKQNPTKQTEEKKMENEDKKETKSFVCTICGYVYEGEELPADFICPICKHGAEDFEEM